VTQPFLGQIQPFGFGFAPRNWALCNGQLLSISQNTALFALLGTQYGGNGTTNFALPNFQSRVPVHKGTFAGNTYVIGEEAGVETVTLLQSQLPAHNHTFSGMSGAANFKQPVDGAALAQSNLKGTSPGDAYYVPDNSPQITSLNIGTLSFYGRNGPHTNIQPYLTVNRCIAMAGIFPSRN